MSIARRLAAIEAEQNRHALALPPREWLRRGWLASLLEWLPPAERAELVEILEQSFTDAGAIDHRRLTPEQQARGSALCERMKGMIP